MSFMKHDRSEECGGLSGRWSSSVYDQLFKLPNSNHTVVEVEQS